MRMKREAKQIVERAAFAFAAAVTSNPEELRQAAAHIRGPACWAGDEDSREAIEAYAALLEKKADHKERLFREAFAPKE